MQLEVVPIDQLHFDPVNARKHSDKNLKAIKGSLAKFGQQKPIVVDANNVVLAGNGTLAAAKSLGWSDIQVVRTKLMGSEAIAYALADNRSSELAEWEDSVLSKTLDALKKEKWDLASIGFEDEDLTQWLTDTTVHPPGADEDEVPEHVEPVTKLGDLYELGDHRLLCGDSTDILQVERLMNGEKADMVFTDPPYGIDEETDRAFAAPSRVAKGNTFKKIIGDDTIDTALAAFSIADSHSKTVCYWGGNYYAHKLPPSPCWVVWDKRVEENQRDFNSDCELAYVKHPNKKSVRIFRHLWKGIIKGSENGEGRVHPTQKPIALAEWCFGELAPDSKVVLDLFLGSGSTLIACEKTNRKCYGMEIDPHYVDIIISRWEKYTGKKAKLLPRES